MCDGRCGKRKDGREKWREWGGKLRDEISGAVFEKLCLLGFESGWKQRWRIPDNGKCLDAMFKKMVERKGKLEAILVNWGDGGDLARRACEKDDGKTYEANGAVKDR
jgi:hypothetical protein